MRIKATTAIKQLANTSESNSVISFAPLINGSDAGDWVKDVINTVTPEYGRNGEVLKYKRKGLSVMWQAPWCLTQLTKEMYCAQRMGLVGYADAVGRLNKLNNVLTVTQGIIHTELNRVSSDNRQMEIPPTIAVHTSIRSEHMAGEASDNKHKSELDLLMEEQLADDSGYYDHAAEADFVHQEWETQRFMRDAQSNGQKGNGKDKPNEMEGWLDVALHEPSQLFDYKPQDIRGARGMMTKVIVRLLGLKMPMDHPAYDRLLARLTEAWAATESYFKVEALKELRREGIKFPKQAQIDERADEKVATHRAKCAKRALIMEQGLLAEPTEEMKMAAGTYERWAVNHATRRMWRDMATLHKQRTRIQKQLDDCLLLEMEEERSGRPNPTWARSVANEEGQDFDDYEGRQARSRTWYLAGWEEVTEAQCLAGGEHRNASYGSVITQKDWAVNEKIKGTQWIVEKPSEDITWFDRETGPDGKKRAFRRTMGDFTTAGERERAILSRVLERIDANMDDIRSLYKEMRKLDKALAPVWKALHVPAEELKPGQPLMPEQPPVYWNLEGFYTTQDEAKNALENEAKTAIDLEALEACGDRAADALRARMVGAKFDI
jgi:hypothetical protein